MRKLNSVLLTILYLIASIAALLSLLSLFRNLEIRYIKMLDFPRIQFCIFSLVILIPILLIQKQKQLYKRLFVAALSTGIAINAYFLVNYTTLVPVAVPSVTKITDSDRKVSILLSNVKMKNRKSDPILKLIEQKNPDLVLLMEVDKWWDKELRTLKEKYPYSQHTINKVTYGMVLYSKYPLKKVDVDYLTNKNVPSFESTISLSNGKQISFHSLHPVPPTHFEDLPDNAGQQENALQKLGKKIEGRKFPTIVAGDLNDVVWSYVDELTETKNILYDVRVGRGFYNSFNAENILMRWPLDHIFVTEEFKLKKLERLPKTGSDHFPLYVELVLSNGAAINQK